MRIVQISDLDQALRHCDEGYSVSHDEAYRRFSQISIAQPADLPEDPFSEAYRNTYLDLYRRISSRDQYEVDNERTFFDVDDLTLKPFPYYTKSLKLAAQHFSLMGQLLGMMDCKPNSDILEFGFGWGNTTLALAMLGHRVTAVDVEENFCELVRRRAKIAGVDIDVVHSDFMWAETTDKQFDAVVFFECFHHCWDFERLLKALHRVLKPGGKIYFGAEPISEDFPAPWGLRLDGESLFVARRCGWMELGFRSDFFAELLHRSGWRSDNVAHHFWVASAASDAMEPIILAGSDPSLGTIIGTRTEAGIEIASEAAREGGGFALFGPYIRLPAGSFEGVIQIEGSSGMDGAYIDAAAESGTLDLGGRRVDSREADSGSLRLAFMLERPASAVELRLQVPGGSKGLIRTVTISEIPQGRDDR